jgi:hypothetical protein
MIALKKGMLVVALLSVPISKLTACSITEICPHHGFEAAKNFTVTIHHAGKPLQGVLVKVIPDDDGVDIAGITEALGVIQFEDLRPGNYHISVSMLGISAVYQCFHVSKWTTGLNAKRTLTYGWGDDAPETRQIAGKVRSHSFIMDANGQHPETASVAGIHLTLTDPLSGVRSETTTSPEGLFRFSGISEGVYVLHSDGNERLRYYPGDMLIGLSPKAARTELVLELGGGGGDCNGPVYLIN